MCCQRIVRCRACSMRDFATALPPLRPLQGALEALRRGLKRNASAASAALPLEAAAEYKVVPSLTSVNPEEPLSSGGPMSGLGPPTLTKSEAEAILAATAV